MPLAAIERIVSSEPWYVTAAVATTAALLGSVVGAVSTYRLNVVLDRRSRIARAEIRRKAKVYTPIRAELLALRDDIAVDSHLPSGILRADRGYRTMVNPPELYVWRGFVEDGRAMFSASAHVRKALDELDERADNFNAARERALRVFQERGDVILGELRVSPPYTNWARSEVVPLVRHRFAELFSGPVGTQLVGQALQGFTEAWDNDPGIDDASRELADAETALGNSLDAAINEIEKAMSRIAKKHEHEPED